jgi:hypothetical protein
MKSFRDALQPGAVATYKNGWNAFQAVLRHKRFIVWRGDSFFLRDFGPDAREMAKDAAQVVLHCDDGSLTAEELQQIVDKATA